MDKVFITDCYILTKEVLENMLIKELLSKGIKTFNGQPVEKLKLEQVFVSHADMMKAANAGLSISQGANIGFKFSPPPNQTIDINTSFLKTTQNLTNYQNVNINLDNKLGAISDYLNNKIDPDIKKYFETSYTNKEIYLTNEYELYKNEYSKLYQNLYSKKKYNDELHDILDAGEPGFVHYEDKSATTAKPITITTTKPITLDDITKISPVNFDIGKEVVVSKDKDGEYKVEAKEEVLNFDNGIRAIEVD